MISKLKNNQKGIGTAAAILAIAILVVIGAIGWMVYENHHKTVAVTPPSATITKPKIYTDSKKIYTVSYPSNWTTSESLAQGAFGYPFAETNFTQFSLSHSASSAFIGITVFNGNNPEGLFSGGHASNVKETTKSLTINGYQAVHAQLTNIGPNNAAYGGNDEYAVTNKDITLLFDFQYTSGNGSSPAYTALVKSVKFLN